MSFLKENKDNVIVIKEQYMVQKNKKIKRVLIITGIVLLIIGGVVGNAIYQSERKEKIANEVNEYKEEQKTITENTTSNAEAFVEQLNLKLSTEEQFHTVLSGTITLYNEIGYTEKVKSFDLFGVNIKWLNEKIDIYGYADAFFEYGTNIKKIRAEVADDNTVNIFIQKPFFRKESAHRIAGSYSPDPEKPNKSSRDAKRKTQIEVNFEKTNKKSNNIQQRAMIAWEDKFDKNIEPSIYKIHKEDETLSNLNKVGEDSIKDLIESFNINQNNVKINIKVDETIK